MSDAPATRPSLLVRIRDRADHQAWTQFTERYVPLVYGFARKHGLQDADAADLTQEVLRSVSSTIPHWDYDPQRGSFRGWLFTVVRNKLRNFAAARARMAQGTGDTAFQSLLELQPETDEAAQWEEEYQTRLLHWAAEQVRGEVEESTWQAFWRTGILGQEGKQVADELGMSVAAVYLAKSRVMKRLKERAREFDADDVRDP